MAFCFINAHEASRLLGASISTHRDGVCREVCPGVKIGYRDRRWFLLYFEIQHRRTVLNLMGWSWDTLVERMERQIRQHREGVPVPRRLVREAKG